MCQKTVTQITKYGLTTAPRKPLLFVAGAQRSGTNMVMGALERSFDTNVYHERDSRAFHEFEMLPREVIRGLIKNSRAPYVVIKTLCELQELRQILDDFDNSKAIWIIRNYNDVVNSHIERWTSMPWSIGEIIKDRSGAAGWRGRGMSDEVHDFAKEVYHPEISNASACALFWYMRNILFFEQSLDLDSRVSVFGYEALVQDADHEFRRLFQFCGIPYTLRATKLINLGPKTRKIAPVIDKKIQDACDLLEKRFREITAH